MYLEGLDEQTRRLVIQMHLDDLREVKSKKKGKGRYGDVADFDVALDAYKDELEASEQIVSDHALSASIREAVQQDAPAIASLMQEEEQARQDHLMALKLSGGKGKKVTFNLPGETAKTQEGATQPAPTGSDLDDAFLEKLEALFVSDPYQYQLDEDDGETGGQVESSKGAAGRKSPKMVEKRLCFACRDQFDFFDLATFPCKHEYCRECLQSLFKASFTDEGLFPPRCCDKKKFPPISLDNCRLFLTSEIVGEFLAKKLEFGTPNRTYCHRPACSTFVPPQFIRGDVATCPKCSATTCTTCKGASHVGRDCPHDPAVQEVLRIATEEGWQRCSQCQRMVELEQGCNHMSEHLSPQFPKLLMPLTQLFP